MARCSITGYGVLLVTNAIYQRTILVFRKYSAASEKTSCAEMNRHAEIKIPNTTGLYCHSPSDAIQLGRHDDPAATRLKQSHARKFR